MTTQRQAATALSSHRPGPEAAPRQGATSGPGRRLAGSYKVTLLRGAARRGLGALLRQAWLIMADTAWRERHLVFRMTAAQVLASEHTPPPGMAFCEVGSWDDLPQTLRDRLSDPAEALDWGGRDWFARGWRLWIGTVQDEVAVLGWWRNAAQSAGYFCPIPEDAEVLWHVLVLPEYQGRNLHVAHRMSLMRQRVAEGIAAFYTNCREHNTPSHRNILRMGFTPIGCCRIGKLTRRRVWQPVAGTGGRP